MTPISKPISIRDYYANKKEIMKASEVPLKFEQVTQDRLNKINTNKMLYLPSVSGIKIYFISFF